MTVDGVPSDNIAPPPSPPAGLPTIPAWVPPLDTGQPNALDLNDLGTLPKANFAASNQILPITHGRDRLFGQPFVVHVDETAGYLYTAMSFCEGQIAGFEKIIIGGEDALATGLAFEGVRNRGFENGDKTGWDLETNQEGTVNNTVSQTGDWGMNLLVNNGTVATQISNRLKSPPEATVIVFKAWAARNALPTSLPDADAFLIIREATTIGGTLVTTAGGNVNTVSLGDQTIAGWQELVLEYTVPAGVVEYTIGLRTDNTGTGVGSWDFDDISAHIFDVEDDEIEVGIEVTPYVGTQTQVFDGMLSKALTGYVDDLPGVAYISMRSPNGSTSGFPRLEAIIQGRLVYDPRKDDTAGALGPELTFTRTGSAWLLDWEGLYREVDIDDEPRLDASRRVKNLILQSGQMDGVTSPWSGTTTDPVEGNFFDPWGRSTVGVWTLEDDDAGAFESMAHAAITVLDNNARYTMSIYVRKTTNALRTIPAVNYSLSGGTGVSNNVRFDSELGDASGVIDKVESVGEYWRFSFSVTNNTSGNTSLNVTLYPAVQLTPFAGDVVTALGVTTFFGPQIENTTGQADSTAGEYQATLTVPVARTYNTDRNGTLLPAGRGVHIEGERTNTIADSCDISAAGWVNDSGILSDAAFELFPAENNQKFTNDNAGTNRRVRVTNGTFTDTEGEVFSVILENDDALVSRIIIRDETAAGTLHAIEYTWATQALVSTEGTDPKFLEDLGTGPNGGDMVRITVVGVGTGTGTGATGNTIGLHIYPCSALQNALACWVHHAQHERDVLFPSSPIVTVGTGDVTRLKDLLLAPDADIASSWYAAAQGTWLASVNRMWNATGNARIIAGASSETPIAGTGASNFLMSQVTMFNGTTAKTAGAGAFVDGTSIIVTRYDDNERGLTRTNTTEVTDANAVLDTNPPTSFGFGSTVAGGLHGFGFLTEVRYYNVRQDLPWVEDAVLGLIEDGGANYDPSLTLAHNFGRDMSLQGIGAVGGLGTHRVDDSTTWEFSQNPTLHFRDIVENFTGWDILDAGVVANANCNDELIDGVPRRQTGLTMAKANTVDSWVKGHRTYMGAFLNWEGGKIRVIPNRPDVEAPGAIVFDATAGTWVDMGDSAELDFGTSSFTLEATFKAPTSTVTNKTIVSKKLQETTLGAGYVIYMDTVGSIRFRLDDGTNQVTINSTPVEFDDSVFHHVAIIVDQGADTVTMIIDDVEEVAATSIASVALTTSNTQPFRVGALGNSGALFDGSVDEVRVWNDVRTPAELTANRSSEIENPLGDPSLVGYWKMNEATSASVAPDESASGNDGTLAGAAVFGFGDQQIIPDGVAMHIGVDDILKDSLKLKRRSLRAVPNSVAIDYEDSSGTRWFTARTQADSPRVSGGDEARRLSRVSLPGIHNASQAQREATERLNWYLTDLNCTLTLFDEGWNLTHGSIVAVTHPIGLDAKLFRVRQTTAKSGRWTLDLTEYDPAIYSDVVVADPTIPDTNLGNPLNPPTPENLVLAEELFNYKTGTTGSRVRVTWNATAFPFLSQYLIEGYVSGAKVWQTTTQANNIVSPPVEEIVDAIGTPTDYEVRVSIQSPFATGAAAIDNVQIDGKFAIPGDPTGAVAVQTFADEVDLTWVAAVDIDIWRYEVRRGTTSDTWATASSLILVDGLAYTDTGLALGTHRYFIKAIDSVKQESAAAAFVDVTLSAPTAVAGLFGFEVASEVRLNWAAVSNEFVERYRIAYSDYPIETFETTLDIVDTIRFSTKDVPEGTFTFKAYSVDKAGNEAATAAEIVIEVTSDADAFLADTYDFTFRTDAEPDIVANGSLTNFVEWDVRLDSKKYYVTNMADAFAATPTDFVAADPLANYHSTGASEWLSETKDFGLLLTGSWNLTHDTTALLGVVDIALELSTDDITYVSFGGSSKGEFRYARVRISTVASPGTATAFVLSPVMNLKINVVPLEESGESVSSPTAGVGKTINLTREYTALKEITTQPKNTIASGSAVTSIVDNIVIGPNTAIQCNGTEYYSGGDWAELDFGTGDFTIEFITRHDGSSDANSNLMTKRNGSLAGFTVRADYNLFDLEFLIDDGTNQVSVNTTGNALPNDGLPHHYAIVVQRGATDLVTWYVDSVAQTPVTIAAVTGSISNSVNFQLFATNTGTAIHPSGGVLDQVRLWSDARLLAEIEANWNIALDMTQTQSNLVHYQLCDGDVGGVTGNITDVTVNARTLTATGAGDNSYIDPGNGGPNVQKINSFDVFIFDTFGQQLAEEFQWKWKAV